MNVVKRERMYIEHNYLYIYIKDNIQGINDVCLCFFYDVEV